MSTSSLPDLSLIPLVVLAYIVSRALSSIIGEYAKRFWFGLVEPYVSALIAALPPARWKKALAKLESKISDLERDSIDLQRRAEALFVERDDLTAEVIRLRLELMDLRSQRRAS